VRLRLSVTDLLGAIMLRATQVSEGGALRQCLHCAGLFKAGPGSNPKRRLDAKFCTDEHRIAFNSLNRAKGN
jgi:hypothetical protein